MDAGNQQRILGYFIEEAKEHLDTLEHGILDLHLVVQDPEKVNEMFRAAHSVKGGAAMLGFSSIQKTAHRLEDSFKILKENDIKVDQKLESLFLQGYDTLKDLIEQLQGPFGLREEEAEKTIQAAEPAFAKLQSYLERLISGGKASVKASASTPSVDTAKAQKTLVQNFGPQVTEILKQMLQLFKQQDTPSSRQKFQALCKRLAQMGAGIKPWQGLVQVSYKAIANRQNSYQTLAPVVIKELKQACDQLQGGKGSAIAPSPALQKLAAAPTAPTAATNTASKPAAATATAPTAATSTTSKPAAATATAPTAATNTASKPATATATASTSVTNTASKSAAATSAISSTSLKQITLTVEPKAAAEAIVKAFDQKQLLQLVKLLVQATRASS